jgi:ankyrin repeat protein
MMHSWLRGIALPAISFALFLPAWGESKLPPPANVQIDFNRDVRPILEANCLGCHGSKQQQSGLRLDKRQNALRGGDYGAVIMPGNSAISKLVLRVAGSEAGLQMPPTGPLSAEQIGVLRAWIDQGGDFPDVPIGDAQHAPPKPLDPKVRSFLDTVRRGDERAVRQTLQSDPSLAATRDNSGSTALMHAALIGGIGTMRVLLDAGADPNARNERKATALLWGITDPAKVRLLLDRGADPNIQSVEGRTPLYLAAMQPAGTEVAKLLLERGADPNGKDLTGRAPLMVAASTGNTDLMRLLVAKGAKVNLSMGSGATPLISAAGSRSPDAVRFLIERGADVNARTKRGGTALDIAASWGSLEIVQMLLAKGARIDFRDDRGFTPLMYAAYAESRPVEVVRLLLAKGADRNATGEGETAMSLARKRGQTEIVRLLETAAQ